MKRKYKLTDGSVVELAVGSAIPAGAIEVADEPSQDEVIAKAVEKALAPIAAKLAEKATSNMGGAPLNAAASGPTFHTGNVKDAADGKGLHLIRLVKARAVAKMNGTNPAEIAKGWGYDAVAKVLAQGNFTAGGSLVHPEFSGEFLALLRNKTVIRQAGARVLPMGASLTFDRQSSSGTAYYGQENTAITPSEQGTDQITMSEKKLTALTAVSNDLIRNASVGAEEFVRDDLLRVMALREDLAFLRGSGVSSEPRGIRYQTHSDHVYAETTATEGTTTLTEMKTELNKARKALKVANIPMSRCVWFMNPDAENALLNAVGPGGEGTNQLEREMTEKGTLRGMPYYVTNQIPDNLGVGTDESELYLVDMDEVIIGESLGLELEVFPNGAWSNSGTINSGISNDQTVIRALAKHDIALRHTKGAVVVTELSWDYT